MEKLNILVDLAQELKTRKITINVSQNGKVILRMGMEAEPGLLGFLGPIEVRDLKAVLRFILG
jgi:hypothetical protein